jgi:N6-adenosine-specific RNA methylase IME4
LDSNTVPAVRRYPGDSVVDVETGEVMPEEGWKQDESGLPVAEFYTSEAIEGEWSRLKSEDNLNRLQKGALALRVSSRGMYGDQSLEKFARAVGETYGTVAGYMRIYEKVARLEISPRGEILGALDAGTITTSHIKTATAIDSAKVFTALMHRAIDGEPLRKDRRNLATANKPLTVAQTASKAKPIIARQRRKAQAALAEANPVEDEQRGKYHTIVIDPPWQMEKIEREVRHLQHDFDYPTMSGEELATFEPMHTLPAEDCHLYLWTTHKHLPLALELAGAWGFKYECLLTWVKNVGFTPFSWMRSTEHVLFCRKGSPEMLRKGERLDFHAKVREHSRKPDEFYEVVRRVSPGPRIDVFSREDRPGFDSWGNEAGRFSVA